MFKMFVQTLHMYSVRGIVLFSVSLQVLTRRLFPFTSALLSFALVSLDSAVDLAPWLFISLCPVSLTHLRVKCHPSLLILDINGNRSINSCFSKFEADSVNMVGREGQHYAEEERTQS